MYSNKMMLLIGAVTVVLSMTACQKMDFQQNISMKSPLTTMKPRQVVTATVTITNTSKMDWPAGGASPVRLSYHWIDRSQKVVVFDGERTVLPKDLNAGESVEVQATIKSPDQPGDYGLQMTMMQEGVAWFDDKGAKPLTLPVTVK